MDIRNLIDSDKTDLSQAEIHYSSDEQGIPFGLTLEITPFFADEIEDVKK